MLGDASGQVLGEVLGDVRCCTDKEGEWQILQLNSGQCGVDRGFQPSEGRRIEASLDSGSSHSGARKAHILSLTRSCYRSCYSV